MNVVSSLFSKSGSGIAALLLVTGCSGNFEGHAPASAGKPASAVDAGSGASLGSTPAAVSPTASHSTSPVAPTLPSVASQPASPATPAAQQPVPAAAPVAAPVAAPTCANPITVTCNGATKIVCSGQSITCSGGGTSSPPQMPAAAPAMPPVAAPVAPPAAPPLPKSDYITRWVFLDQIHGDIFASTMYQHVAGTGNEVPIIDFWARRYDPSVGVTCRAIIQAFLLAHPSRPLALQAIGSNAGFNTPQGFSLFQYIGMEYQALLPGVESQIFTVYNQGIAGAISLDGIDNLFLDHPLLKIRCENAGMVF